MLNQVPVVPCSPVTADEQFLRQVIFRNLKKFNENIMQLKIDPKYIELS